MQFLPDSNAPLFVISTRLFAYYRFRTRNTFDVPAAMQDDDYARDVLRMVRAVPDAKLQAFADQFELQRFTGGGQSRSSDVDPEKLFG